MHKVVVTGGNGFVGSEICRQAVSAGMRVSAVARHGRGGIREPWAERVEWFAADVLEPAAWRPALDGADAVVHCVGIIREHPERGITFERLNGDSAIVAAAAAAEAGVESFVFLSAREVPVVMRAYLRAKRRAEREIGAMSLRTVFLRPGLVYGAGRPVSYLGAAPLLAAGAVPYLAALVHAGRPLPVQTVADAALRAATDPAIRGVLDVNAIATLAEKS